MNHEATELRRELAHERAKQQWQPIASAPRDDTVVLGWDGEDVRIMSFWLTWGAHVEDWNDDSMYAPTHWMPLPAPPK